MKRTTLRGSILNRLGHGLRGLLALAMLSAAASGFATQLTWDPLNNGGSVGGSGNWDTTDTFWYNGTADVPWAQTATTTGTDGAIFGGGDGTYFVTNTVETAYTNIAINNSGYTFSGSELYGAGNATMMVAAGKSVTFNNEQTGAGNGSEYFEAGAGAVVSFADGATGGQQPQFQTLSTGPGATFYFGGSFGYSVTWVAATCIQTNGSYYPNGFFCGRPCSSGLGSAASNGVWIVTGPSTTFNMNSANLIVARGGAHGTFIVTNGASASTVNTGGTAINNNLVLCNENNNNDQAIVDVDGGTLTVGTGSSTTGGVLQMIPSGGTATTFAQFDQTNGVAYAWGGIFFGENTSATYPAGCYANLTNSGGTLYVGAVGPNGGGGINRGTYAPPAINISFSGGTIGALGNWSSPLPITLGTLNGNITFQCADNGGTPHNITLAGPLSGPGGFNLTGGGILTLSATNTYSGSTTISNAELVLNTANVSMTDGAVTLDGSVGNSELSMQLTVGQEWTVPGLTYQNGNSTITSDFQFGSVPPGTSVAPIQVAGNLNFAATPVISVEGTVIPAGTYPLITYGTVSGTPPTSGNLPGYLSGYITNLTASKTIALVVTSSTVSPSLVWTPASGTWDFTTANWTQFGGTVKYTDNSAVLFKDTAGGTATNINVVLNTLVQPQSVTFDNASKSYTVAGTGSISGPSSLSLLGGGIVTLDATNSYSGGTVLAAGQLNINNGGDSSGLDSAIGTGLLTIAANTAIDNTSGSNLFLQPSIPEAWNGNFTYIGSTNSFNTGAGNVTMNAGTTITVNSNNFTVGGYLTDDGNNFKLTKTGNGSLTLSNGNSFEGGFELVSGLVNLGDPNAAGQGLFIVDGGSMDNVSTQPNTLTLAVDGYQWYSSFSYLGSTTNILDLGTGLIQCNGQATTVTVVSNTLEIDGDVQSGNQMVYKAGPGTLVFGGSSDNNNQLGMTVLAGVVDLNRSSGYVIANTGGGAKGLIVTNGSMVVDMGANQGGQQQLGHGANSVPLSIATGGIFDLAGSSEIIDVLNLTGGTLQNENTNYTQSTLTIGSPGIGNLLTATNQINVGQTASLVLNGILTGAGSITMNGPGTLMLSSNQTYTGETTIQGGTIALLDGAAISGSADIYLANATAALDLSQNTDTNGNPDDTLTLNAGQTLSGFGTVTGLLASVSGSIVMPGSVTQVGTLTITGDTGASSLAGSLILSLNNTNAQNCSQVAFASGSATYSGTLAVANVGPALKAGNKFQLFPSALTTFTAINLPATDNGNTITWSNNVAQDGSVTVATVTPVVTINPLPGVLQSKLTGTTLNLAWPTNSGWLLQAQTNSLKTGLVAGSNAWFTVAGSGSITNLSIQVSPTNGATFYRMVHP